MKCLECHQDLVRLDNEHLANCCGLTLQEYAIRHHLPLDILVDLDRLNLKESVDHYPRISTPDNPLARAYLTGLLLAGKVCRAQGLSFIEGDIKRLELLLWCLQDLEAFGFKFRQEYFYSDHSHRVVARNRLKTRSGNVEFLQDRIDLDTSHLLDTLAVLVAFNGELHANYLFIPLADTEICASLLQKMHQQYRVAFKSLEACAQPQGALLRTETERDTREFLSLIKDRLLSMPGCEERLYLDGPRATVVKELLFDSAHFITDYPGKCSNLHGGRYSIKVKVADRIDPATGFVLDYGYLKAVVERLVVAQLDHQSLNYVGAELAWRSSTELLSIFIWEQLIEYLPGLSELQIHETAHSYCCYTGPSLAEFQVHGPSPLLNHFKDPELGRSPLRAKFIESGG
ncbi:MAG: 6-carboxytetrahydropterin synthase [Pseudomonadota bacterium]